MDAGYFWWTGGKALPITAREADRYHRDTDAGTDDRFIVIANCWCEAERGARMWIENRADETAEMTPDGVGLYEREYRLGKTYMVLTVDLGECRAARPCACAARPPKCPLPAIVQPRVSAMDRAEAMRMAEIRLIQSEELRLGYLRDSFVSDACGYLRAAGAGELADRLEDDPWGSESGAVLAEVTRMIDRPMTRPDTAADMPSAPLSRDAALRRVRVLLADIPDDEYRDALFAAIIDFGHASATEVLNQCQAAIREVYGAPPAETEARP